MEEKEKENETDVVAGVRGGLGVAAQKVQRNGPAQAEVEGLQDAVLHAQDGLLGVGLVGHVDEVVDFGSVHLLEFGRHEHGRQADQLQLVPDHRRVRLLVFFFI